MKLKGGYAGTHLVVDLSKGTASRKPLDERLALDYLGGRGFTSRLQYDLIPRDADPLGPKNVAVVGLGMLTGTRAACSGRFTLGARSPLTNILGDGNSGGRWGAVVRRAGYDVITIHGQSPRPVYLWIDNDKVEIRDAEHLWGQDTRRTEHLLREDLGRGISVASIGPAGENLVRLAGFMVDCEHTAGRCGLGAVLGSKKLKAIAVRGSRPVPLHDANAFNEISAEMDELLTNDEMCNTVVPKYGTTMLISHHYNIGMMNARNYQSVVASDSKEFGPEMKKRIDGDALNAEYLLKPEGCYRCALKCDRHCKVKVGEFAGVDVGGPEYSTVVSFGPGCGNDNLASILKANELCNLYGLDTIGTGNLISFAMELYQRGIITQADTDGIDLSWGNYKSIIQMVDKIAFRQGFGAVLAEGIVRAAAKIGNNADRYAVHVKGLTPPPPDARAMKVYNFRYAVSPRGADHLRISAAGAYAYEKMPIQEAADNMRKWENLVTIPDLIGTCKFAYVYFADSVEKTIKKLTEIVPALYTAGTGIKMTSDDLLLIAERVNNLERAYNSRLGLTAEHDTLPPRFTQDALPAGPSRGAVYDILEPMKKAWYKNHQWDENGIPRRCKLEQLNMKDIADDLQKHGIAVTP
jgi:aldehyde:ferredoxin oxidoreductase